LILACGRPTTTANKACSDPLAMNRSRRVSLVLTFMAVLLT